MKFGCKVCGIKNETTTIRARRPGEDLQKWMQVVLRNVSFRHQMVSFCCEATTLDYLSIPCNNKDQTRIGEYTDIIPPDKPEEPADAGPKPCP